MADRNVVPYYFWVFHFHAQFMEKRYGTINGVDAYKRDGQITPKKVYEISKISEDFQDFQDFFKIS